MILAVFSSQNLVSLLISSAISFSVSLSSISVRTSSASIVRHVLSLGIYLPGMEVSAKTLGEGCTVVSASGAAEARVVFSLDTSTAESVSTALDVSEEVVPVSSVCCADSISNKVFTLTLGVSSGYRLVRRYTSYAVLLGVLSSSR